MEISWRIPVTIQPFFWVTAALIGWMNSGTLFGIFVWMGIVFVSILFHEFGHAITAALFKQKAAIQLVAFGGLTTYDGPKLKFWQQFIIVFNGPFFGFLLFAFATFILQFEWSPLWTAIFKMTQLANLFWSILNLFPVVPLDGGQLLRIVLEASFGVKGYRASLLFGTVFSCVVALGFFVLQNFLIGSFFFLFAFQSFDLWRKSKISTGEDRDESIRLRFLEAEMAMAAGKHKDAERIFLEIKDKTKSGLFHSNAMQYLAFLKAHAGNKEEAYQLLLQVTDQLSNEGSCLLHELASAHQNWDLVTKLSATCFQIAPTQEMALNNARAFAHLGQAKFAGGWLQTAAMNGTLEIGNILNEETFQAIKHEPEFEQFIRPLQ